MLILAISDRRDAYDPSRIGELQAAEAKKVWELYLEGHIKQFWFDADRTPDPKGILLIEADSREAARELVTNKLPLVEEGFIDFDLYVLGAYPALPLAFK